MAVNPNLSEWTDFRKVKAHGKRALVVGCGLGDDAEYLAEQGFSVTAFDISPTLHRLVPSSVSGLDG